MPYLIYEVLLPGKDYWKPLHAIYPHDLPGSSIDNTAGRGDVILFSCMGPTSVIARAIGAAHSMREYSPLLRGVLTPPDLTVTLAQISHGQTYERDMLSVKGMAYRARWVHHG